MVSMEGYERRLGQLAVRFANDYGPLNKANQGDQKAITTMADRLTEMAVSCGLLIEPVQEK